MIVKLRLPIVWGIKRNVGFKLSILAYYKLGELLGVDLDKMTEVDRVDQFKALLYTSALAYYVEEAGRIPKWLKPEMGDYWYNHMTLPQGSIFTEAIAKSQSEVKGETSKKK